MLPKWGKRELRIGYWWESQRKEPLGRPRRRWVDLLEIGWGCVDWIGLAQDKNNWRVLVNAVTNLRVP
jgi:hypothetical protein